VSRTYYATIAFLLSFIAGIGLGHFWLPAPAWPIAAALILVALALLLRRYLLPLLVLISLLGLFLGIVRMDFSQIDFGPQDLAYYNGQKLSVQGTVAADPDISAEKIRLTINTDKALIDGQLKEIHGKVLVTLPRYPEYQYGQKLEILGDIKQPTSFTDFSYQNYLARYGIYSVVYYPKEVKIFAGNFGSPALQAIYRFKHRFQDSLLGALPEPHASLASGILLGRQGNFNQQLLDAFNRVGLTHIIAVSGFNITIIAVVILALFKPFHRRLGIFAALLAIIFFVFLTGASASVVRAAIMGGINLLALSVYRQQDKHLTILLAAFLMLLVNPLILFFDVGFQLSFAATLGIVYVSPIFEQWFQKIPNALGLREALMLTIAAQITAVPFIIYHFGRLSIISPLANLLVVPLVPAAMLFSFITGLIGLVTTGIAQLLGAITWIILAYIIEVTKLLSNWRLASPDITKLRQWWMAAYFLVVLVLVTWWWRRKNSRQLAVKQ